MTHMDLHPTDYLLHDTSVVRDSSLRDLRLDRDPQKDLHDAIDLAYAFAGAIKGLHPIAERQIKAMIFQGNLL